MVGGRELVEQRRQVHFGEAVEASAAVESSNLRSDPADDEVLEDLRHWIWLTKSTILSLSLWNRREGSLRSGSTACLLAGDDCL